MALGRKCIYNHPYNEGPIPARSREQEIMIIRTTANWSWWVRTIRATLAILFIVPFLSGCGLVFVKGPPTGWQGVEDADQLEISAIAQPCTTSKTLVWLDEFYPAPDFGVASQNLPAIISPVTGFSPVFSGSISNSPEH